jgi:hypothetical protein
MIEELDYYKDLIDVVVAYKHYNNFDLNEILELLPNDDHDVIKLTYQEY